MPGTVQDLSRKLLSAIDPEGNVTDMGVVLEVVDALEGIKVTADDIRTNCLGRNINQLRRKLTDSNKSLARRLKKLVKTWQQLIQSQTPNGLTTPSLGGGGGTVGGANRVEPPVTGVNQKLSNRVDSRRRSVSSSREGTPSQSTAEPPTSKSGPPLESKNTSRTSTPTPPPPPPQKSSVQAPPTSALASATPLQPPTAPVIPRPTKAQDFARNRIRRMQMFSAVKKPTTAPVQGTFQSQPAPSDASTAQTSVNELPPQQQQQQPPESVGPVAEAAPFQSHPPQQTILPPISNSFNSANKTPDVLPHPHSLSSAPVANGSRTSPPNHTSLSPSPPLSTSRSSPHTAKLTNSLPKPTASLSQIVTNSFNHERSTSASEQHSTSHSSSSLLTQSLVTHKVGVQDVWNENSNSHLDTSLPVPESLSFVVRIPRSLLHRQPPQDSKRNDFSDKNEGTKSLNKESVVPSKREKLIVSIDLSLVQRVGQAATSWQIGRNTCDIRPNRTEQLLVNHRDRTGLDEGEMKLPPAVKQNSHKSITSCDFDEPMETDSKHLFGTHDASFAQPQLIPSGAYPGVDGCLGDDGYWYSWTDLIPGRDESVTVLPYIYIDDDSCDALVSATQ